MDRMTDRRKPATLTPESEDQGLFQSDLLLVEVKLSPMTYRNKRNDVIVRGFTEKDRDFEVSFAGRRSAMAAPLIANLTALRKSFEQQLKDKKIGPYELEKIQVPILVEGAWRRRFWVDANGWQGKTNQLVAARWSVKGREGKVLTFGVSPAQTLVDSAVVGHWRASQGGHVQQPARGN